MKSSLSSFLRAGSLFWNYPPNEAIPFRSAHTSPNEALQAKLFVEFIALIIRNRFFNLLKEQMERLKTRRNTLTVLGAIRELDKMEMTRLNGGHYLLDHALTKNQKIIFQSFGLSVEKVFEEVKVLTEKLIAAVDEKIVEKDVGEDEDAETEVD